MAVTVDSASVRRLLRKDEGIGAELLKVAKRRTAQLNSECSSNMHAPMREPFGCELRRLTYTQAAVIHPKTKGGAAMARKRGALHW